MTSHDLEDVVRVIDGRPEIEGELSRASPELVEFVAEEMRRCRADRFFVEALPDYFGSASEGWPRARLVLECMARMSGD